MKEFVCELQVRGYELDSFGHVNHSTYLNYLEHARWKALAEGGFSYDALRGRGWAIHVAGVEVRYLKPCFEGQRLQIRTRVEQFRHSSMTMGQEIHRVADEPDVGPAVRSLVTAVFIGQDGRPMRIPPAARQALGG